MPPKAKKIAAVIKLQIQAGAATPAPPVGPALGQHGVNIMDFVKQYNAATESQRGNVIPVEISVFDRASRSSDSAWLRSDLSAVIPGRRATASPESITWCCKPIWIPGPGLRPGPA